ncbi:hypothetical protein [Nonomuraea ferruginea]|uniref:Uncharacterized protein n=1 Tax=Nonomuraea ferruginea TaxID=46174 RepID=A0ABT4TCY5_9ACTN|nr:hypothetical protein [Nonomuraea ferruginea]MDA0647372.1 hypothetical protein [Nonomuraea ferruginea]
MLDSLIVPLFVTTDLPPRAELAEFGELVAGAARTLGYDAFLSGKVFWLDRPVLPGQRPAAETESRFAGMLGHLAVSGDAHPVREVVADLRTAIGAAVSVRYGDAGAPPAVFAIRDRDVRERTPDTALHIGTRDAPAELVTVARPYL